MIMKDKKNKKNSFSKKGIVLILALIISSIIFTIALGVISISVKELNFSTSARETNDAFFAAETGAECALYSDISGNFPIETEEPAIGPTNCIFGDTNNTSLSNPWKFTLGKIGNSDKACAIVSIEKSFDSNGKLLSSKITSKGYNVGDSSCSGSNRVERVLELNY